MNYLGILHCIYIKNTLNNVILLFMLYGNVLEDEYNFFLYCLLKWQSRNDLERPIENDFLHITIFNPWANSVISNYFFK